MPTFIQMSRLLNAIKLFLCHKSKNDLQGTQALKYIKWGEEQGFHRRSTTSSRARWWDLGKRESSNANLSYLVNEFLKVYFSNRPIRVSDNFQEIHPINNQAEKVVAACCSVICQLSLNVLGRSNFGGGLLKIQTYEVEKLLIPNPNIFSHNVKEILNNIRTFNFEDPSFQKLNYSVFRALGLTSSEEEKAYDALKKLVENRIKKSESV